MTETSKYNDIEEFITNNEQKSRRRREAFTGSASRVRLLGALAIILSAIAVLSTQHGVRKLVRRFF